MAADSIRKQMEESIAVKQALLASCLPVVERICAACVEAARNGHTLFFCGNGGSFTDATHIVGELVGRYGYDRPGIAAHTLGSNVASLTAIGNDYGYEDIFVREVDALVKKGDVVIGLSTSGGSKNVVKALTRAKEKGAVTIGWAGAKTGTLMDALCDIVLHVPSPATPRIQESHILVGHIVAGAVEAAVFPRKQPA